MRAGWMWRVFAGAVGLVAGLGTVSAALWAQASAAPAVAKPWREHLLTSAVLKEERRVLVAPPTGYDSTSRRYPVLILLDADDQEQFAAAIANVEFLANRRAIPPLLVVGIANGKDRTRDMTPALQASARAMMPTSGGMDAFLDYIEQEVLPLVRAQYRTATYQVFAGHSLGGLTAVYVAGARPNLAQGVIAMSPSLWINDEAFVRPWASAVATRTAPLRLFSTRGGEEPPIDVSTRKFAARVDTLLRRRPAAPVQVAHRRYPADPHGITPLASLVDGLRFVFADYSTAVTAIDRLPNPFTADSATWMRAFGGAEQQWAKRQRAFSPTMLGDAGADDQLPAYYFELAGMLAPISRGAALGIATRGVQLRPTSAGAHQNLATVLLVSGDSAAARGHLMKALELARAAKDSTAASGAEQALKALDTPTKRPGGH